MATIAPVSMAEAATQMTIRVRVTHQKRTAFRLWLSTAVLRLAVLVCPCQVELGDAE